MSPTLAEDSQFLAVHEAKFDTAVLVLLAADKLIAGITSKQRWNGK